MPNPRLICLSTVLLLCFAGCAWAAPGETPGVVPPSASLISVGGTGEVAVAPDQALVSVGVVSQKPSAQAAQTAVNQVANKLLAALRELGVAERDQQTAELQIFPVYAQDRGDDPRITGYRASNVVRVRVRNLSQLGEVIDRALSAGGNRVDGVQFELEDDSAARAKALERAVADGRAKAETIAAALGGTLGRVVRAQEAAGIGPSPVMRTEFMAARSSTPTAPGEIRVSAQVSLEYELE